MKLQLEIHPVQAEILRNLLFKTEARYTELNTTELDSNHFDFHIKRVMEIGLVAKNENQKYELTQIGKEFANRFDTDTKEVERQGKIAVRMIGVRDIDGDVEYLIQERLKQPFFGYFGTIGGKVRWGETLFEAAQRELEEETGLTGEFKLVGIQHKMDYNQKEELLEDKFFFIIKITNIEGNLVEAFEGGRNIWMKKDDLLRTPKLFPNMPQVLEMIDKEDMDFFEKKYTVAEY
jgi:8-oxo-dGTP pyrophosphatase MutT (NUDIX family)